jgi:hypothetical protein
MFPHRIHGDTADIRDNRIIYSMPRAVAPWLLYFHKRFYNRAATYPEESYRKNDFEWAAKCNYDNGNCVFTTNACKSFGIPQAVNRNGATTHKAIKKFEGKTVYFEDGSKFENCDAVVCCSGYYLEIEAMGKEFHESFRDPRSFWKSMVSPDIEDFYLLGFLRPHQINLVSCAEMQARAMALLVSGKKALPSRDEMLADVKKFKTHMMTYFTNTRGPAVIDFIYYMDSLAKFVGCAPNMTWYMFTDPRMFWNMVFGPFQPCQYRLTGPGANFGQSRDAIMASPYYSDTVNCVMRDAFVFTKMLVYGFSGCFSEKWSIVGSLRRPFQIMSIAMLVMWFYLVLSFMEGGSSFGVLSISMLPMLVMKLFF